MTTVNDLLRVKGNDVWSIGPDASVYEALALLAEKDVGALAVVDAGRLVGIVSERDYARKVILKGKTSRETPVREIMTEKVLWVRLDHSIEECMALMTNRRVRHLPVLDEGRLIGMISIGDVVKAIISEQEFMIEQLANYITGVR
jgi:CBS domain-containing protein